MAQFRKKPVVIEAFQMTKARSNDNSEWPVWLHRAWNKESNEEGCLGIQDTIERKFYINTLEGHLLITWDDFIIQGVNGEIYPCKPDIFEKTYEAV